MGHLFVGHLLCPRQEAPQFEAQGVEEEGRAQEAQVPPPQVEEGRGGGRLSAVRWGWGGRGHWVCSVISVLLWCVTHGMLHISPNGLCSPVVVMYRHVVYQHIFLGFHERHKCC